MSGLLVQRVSRRELLLWWRGVGVVVAAVLVGCCVMPFAAQAAETTGRPQLTVTAVSRPSVFAPSGAAEGQEYVATVTNTGGAATNGEPIVITDELPNGLTVPATGASGQDELAATNGEPSDVTCAFRTCTIDRVLPVDDTVIVTFPVEITGIGGAGSLRNEVRAFGGGAATAAMTTTTVVSAEGGKAARFGMASGGVSSALSSDQAGAHADLTASAAFNTINREGATAGNLKNITYDLPAGFVVDLVDTPTCQPAVFLRGECPAVTQVGVTTITITGSTIAGPHVEPVYNLTPDQGRVAKLGFTVGEYHYVGEVSVRPGDYGGETTFYNATADVVDVVSVSLTIWGVPAATIHNPLRWQHGPEGNGPEGNFGVVSEATPAPFFTNATVCGTSLEASYTVDSWQAPGEEQHESVVFGSLVGCDRLGISPTVSALSTTSEAYAPSGLNFGVTVPQTYENASGLASSTVKRTTVSLPEGMVVNPSAGAGLAACSEAQFDQEAAEQVPGVGCPSEAKVGTIHITTPVLKEELAGSVYIAQPYANPFGSLLALYVIARLPERGLIIHAAGEVEPNPLTGQLVTTFDDLPPLPFSHLSFQFKEGQTAPLVTPEACGSYAASVGLNPWADPEEVIAPEVSPFTLTSGLDCAPGAVPPFAPQLQAGTVSPVAGSYSPLSLRISRNDGEQEITGFATQLPPGLTGNLTGIPFCGENEIQRARAQTGTQAETEPACPTASRIGSTIAEAGVGSVLVQTPGTLYLSGPFEGAPFSVVDITSAKVGPFDLGTVIVHLPLQIDPLTAQVSIPSGPADQIPHIIKGIVVHLRNIRVNVDREHFIINPTNCQPTNIDATIIGSGTNSSAPIGNNPITIHNNFQVANCANLKFEPQFTATTTGKTNKTNGASLTVKLAYPPTTLGTQTNIKQVKVELPKQLPSRLTTLQKACTQAQFKTNPAGCPAASIVGHARAITPILPVPLEGPAYFVSNGGEAFPNLIMVLQGYGITIDLVGDTYISKTGITSSTFKTVPDQPVNSFELTLPQGPYSALAANTNLCAQQLTMPTEFVAQNGATLHQHTTIEVEGCPNALAITTHKVKKRTLTLKVYVPAQGKLRIAAKGLTAKTTTVKGRETLTVTLHQKRAGRLHTRVTVLYTPTTGKSRRRQVKTLRIYFRG